MIIDQDLFVSLQGKYTDCGRFMMYQHYDAGNDLLLCMQPNFGCAVLKQGDGAIDTNNLNFVKIGQPDMILKKWAKDYKAPVDPSLWLEPFDSKDSDYLDLMGHFKSMMKVTIDSEFSANVKFHSSLLTKLGYSDYVDCKVAIHKNVKTAMHDNLTVLSVYFENLAGFKVYYTRHMANNATIDDILKTGKLKLD